MLRCTHKNKCQNTPCTKLRAVRELTADGMRTNSDASSSPSLALSCWDRCTTWKVDDSFLSMNFFFRPCGSCVCVCHTMITVPHNGGER